MPKATQPANGRNQIFLAAIQHSFHHIKLQNNTLRPWWEVGRPKQLCKLPTLLTDSESILSQPGVIN